MPFTRRSQGCVARVKGGDGGRQRRPELTRSSDQWRRVNLNGKKRRKIDERQRGPRKRNTARGPYAWADGPRPIIGGIDRCLEDDRRDKITGQRPGGRSARVPPRPRSSSLVGVLYQVLLVRNPVYNVASWFCKSRCQTLIGGSRRQCGHCNSPHSTVLLR